ncbi:AAA family ATPase [Clostridium sp. FP2]|uniref:AAA family ATPase n=1 Tax=Clostridium sp. FP2 TaxID=2724481 RepID=UPI0013E948CF|nr:ATP-binding protein [Clostridium sp. FP2]MBZ9624414.1 AAA family ATPase [Clostridium sp. FP2]
MQYINKLNIVNFRGLNNVELTNTQQINILVGDNNSGKTSILEAIQLLEYPKEPGSFVKVARKRETQYSLTTFGMLTPYESFMNMFNKKYKNKMICLEAQINDETINLEIKGYEEKILMEIHDNEKICSHQFDLGDNNGEMKSFIGKFKLIESNVETVSNFKFDENDKSFKISNDESLRLMKTDYLSPVDHYAQNKLVKVISNAVKSGGKNDIIEMLTAFDKNIIGLELLGEERRTVPYLQHNKLGLIPLSVFGDGIKKVILIACSILSLKDGVLLIDEIETAIHTSALKDFFKWFVNACKKYNTQVFITTHSVEAIDAILEGSKDHLSDIVCYRLEDDNSDMYVNRISGEKLYGIRNNLGLDVR